ncbi:LEAF RUST 10 DISEASE-RESISTANCE LOCUS RECEPTOR-LIKE PROTEIN KINASE-like 1.2 isoform X2 [Nymphaea colorata]|nr:LEAF RUST 10 DISEASE-RESISTANCE LOCUS RECEPTOR-LIKE PROTEIN KINASE-like 1.2 isoform X2 [Nymphaea colorata]
MPLHHRHLLLFLLLPFFFFFFIAAISAKNLSDYCPQTRCGSLIVKYPFYLESTAPSSSQSICGYEGFGINCSTGNPILTLPSDVYLVKSIDYNSKKLSLVDTEIGFNLCPAPGHNVSLDPNSTLKWDPVNTHYFFLINCTKNQSPSSNGYPPPTSSEYTLPMINCLSNQYYRSYVLPPDKASVSAQWLPVCNRSVLVPFAGVVSIPDNGGFPMTVKSGFMLDWSQAALCSGCEATQGCCGRKTTTGQFVCFCNDGLHDKNCKDRNRSKSKIIIGVVSASSSFLLAIIGFFVWRCLGKKRTPSSKGFLTRSFSSSKTSSTIDMESRSFHQRCAGRVTIFTYKELEEATHNFSPSNELGDGGFGAVYLGNLHDGRKVAVKKLYENNYKRVEQFMNEIAILSGISHPNLVCLYGCTSRHSRELLLVYEYVNNGTVGDHIHGMRSSGGHLTWKVRLNIAVETAGALAHLHGLEPPIIHRDVKTNNILLDRDFHVKVADFGLSRLFPLDVTHVSTAPQGTPGYVDPDYHKCYQLTEKSDVYSFGVVLAELISSLPAVDIRRHRHEINLANLAVNKINNHELHEFVDSSLEFETDEWVNRTVRAVAELAFRCLVQEREIRPTMDEVAETLRQIQSGECESDKVALSPEKETGALLKPTSPKSVTDQWPSHYTTPNNSG